jgi:large subunit ribosomal protein L24
MKIKKDDKVLIISGKDRNKTGKVIKTFPKERKVVVEGVNLIKKHQKPTRRGEKGQIIQMPGRIDVSNIALICGKCKKATRVGYEIKGDKKYRICKKCGKKI